MGGGGGVAGGLDQFGHGEERDERQHRDDGDVLGQQDRKARLAAIGAHQTLFVQGLQHDGGGRERQDEADGERDRPGLAERHGDGGDGERGEADLTAAEAEKAQAHGPEHFRLELKPDEEEHHDDAEFGEMLERDDIYVEQRQQRRDGDAGDEIAEHRAEAEFRGDGDGDDPGDEEDEGEKKEIGHVTAPVAPSE